MDKQQIQKMIVDKFLMETSIETMVKVGDFIFDTIIPKVINSLMMQELPKTNNETMKGYISDLITLTNLYIKDRAKTLYGINIKPFTFIPSQTSTCSPKNTKTKEKRRKKTRKVGN